MWFIVVSVPLWTFITLGCIRPICNTLSWLGFMFRLFVLVFVLDVYRFMFGLFAESMPQNRQMILVERANTLFVIHKS